MFDKFTLKNGEVLENKKSVSFNPKTLYI
jgi:hypothetical protein